MYINISYIQVEYNVYQYIRYTSRILTLKLTKLYSTAFAAQFDACVNDFLI